MSSDANPDPVPPPKEWKMRKPCSPVHMSATFLTLSSTRSTSSLPSRSKEERVHFRAQKWYNWHSKPTDSVMPTSVVICSIFFPSYHVFWVEQLFVCASADFIWNPSKRCRSNFNFRAENVPWRWLVYSPTTVGSRSTKTALGTCLPEPVSAKNVEKLSSILSVGLSNGMVPSGWIPCSRQ